MSGGRKLPAMMWYTGDWLKDPAIGQCSASTRGVWVDLLCSMHEASSGRLTGSSITLSRIARCSDAEMLLALQELHDTEAADLHQVDCGINEGDDCNCDQDSYPEIAQDRLTLVCRRLQREFGEQERTRLRRQKAKEKARLRQRSARAKKQESPDGNGSGGDEGVTPCHAHVTVDNSFCHADEDPGVTLVSRPVDKSEKPRIDAGFEPDTEACHTPCHAPVTPPCARAFSSISTSITEQQQHLVGPPPAGVSAHEEPPPTPPAAAADFQDTDGAAESGGPIDGTGKRPRPHLAAPTTELDDQVPPSEDRARASDRPGKARMPDAYAPTEFGEWRDWLVSTRGWPINRAINAKVAVMLREWVAQGVTVGEANLAADVAHARTPQPGSPAYYGPFVADVLNQRGSSSGGPAPVSRDDAERQAERMRRRADDLGLTYPDDITLADITTLVSSAEGERLATAQRANEAEQLRKQAEWHRERGQTELADTLDAQRSRLAGGQA